MTQPLLSPSKQITEISDLTGAERAAVIMLAVGEEASRPIWELLDEDELRELTRAITKLGTVPADIVEQLLYSFVEDMSATSQVSGSIDSASRLLKNVLPADKANLILEDLKGPAGKTMWEKLANVDERLLANYLRNEHPQTIAVILSRVRRDHAARVVAALPVLLGEEVINRLLSLGAVQKDVLDQIERTLKTEFITALRRNDELDPHETIAEIFNHFDRSTERRFLEALENKNPNAAERIKSLMFVFEDLLHLDSADMQLLLRHVDKSALAKALKGARHDITEHFYMNMSERAAKILKDDISIMGPTRLREVDKAQTEIVDTAKKLADAGDIFLQKTKDEELVY